VAPIFKVLRKVGYINKTGGKEAKEVSIEEDKSQVLIKLIKTVINSKYLL
jgi:hypothetical protein